MLSICPSVYFHERYLLRLFSEQYLFSSNHCKNVEKEVEQEKLEASTAHIKGMVLCVHARELGTNKGNLSMMFNLVNLQGVQ